MKAQRLEKKLETLMYSCPGSWYFNVPRAAYGWRGNITVNPKRVAHAASFLGYSKIAMVTAEDCRVQPDGGITFGIMVPTTVNIT